MNENPVQENIPDRHEQRRQRREERRALREGNGWAVGAILVLLGLIMLGQNMNVFTLKNWWALFILLPALGSLGTAWRLFQADGGRLGRHARSALIAGLLLAGLSGMFLFGLNWTWVGPVLLMLAGIAILTNAVLPE